MNAEREPWSRTLRRIRIQSISNFFRRYYVDSPMFDGYRSLDVTGGRPFPHPGNWCGDDELVDIVFPLKHSGALFKVTLRLKWWNFKSRRSSWSKPDIILARACSEMRMMSRLRNAIEGV